MSAYAAAGASETLLQLSIMAFEGTEVGDGQNREEIRIEMRRVSDEKLKRIREWKIKAFAYCEKLGMGPGNYHRYVVDNYGQDFELIQDSISREEAERAQRLRGKSCRIELVDKWSSLETWTALEAIHLVCGIAPPTKLRVLLEEVANAPPIYEGLCGNIFTENFELLEIDNRLRYVQSEWNRRKSPPDRESPHEFYLWCKERKIDTAWLESMGTAVTGSAHIAMATQEDATLEHSRSIVLSESPQQRQDRRLAWIRAHGANHDGSKMTGKRGVLADLARKEEAKGLPMHDEKDIREDLKAAVQREEEARRAGLKGSSVFNQ